MKDIRQVSLNSIVFYVEEDGYIALKRYIDNLERYYADKDSGKEIIEDIQIRFAELLSEKRTFAEQAITLSDIETVIAVLGYPDNFEQEKSRETKHEDAFSPHRKRKQLYRDLENAKIAGVCSGLSHYFGIDEWIFRLVFICSVILGGLGIFLYFVLWLILPPAKTTRQRYEMRGEALNIEDIEQRFKNVINEAEDKIRNFTNKKKVKDFANNSADNIKNTANEISSGAKNIFQVIGKIFGICLIFISLCSIVAILLLWFFPTPSFFGVESGYNIFYLREFFTFLGLNNTAFFLCLLCVILPFVFLLFSGISLITSVLRKTMGVLVLGTFISWIVLTIFVGIGMFTFVADKNITQVIEESTTIELPISSQHIIVKQHPDMNLRKAGVRSQFLNRNIYIKFEDNHSQIYGIPRITHHVAHTNDSIVRLRIFKNFSDEIEEFQNSIRAEDSIIYIPSLFHLKKNYWIEEAIRIEISVPKDVQLTIEEPFIRKKRDCK